MSVLGWLCSTSMVAMVCVTAILCVEMWANRK